MHLLVPSLLHGKWLQQQMTFFLKTAIEFIIRNSTYLQSTPYNSKTRRNIAKAIRNLKSRGTTVSFTAKIPKSNFCTFSGGNPPKAIVHSRGFAEYQGSANKTQVLRKKLSNCYDRQNIFNSPVRICEKGSSSW